MDASHVLGEEALVQGQMNADELLRSLHIWQDEVSRKLADLALLRPIHRGLRSIYSEVHALRQELKFVPKQFDGSMDLGEVGAWQSSRSITGNSKFWVNPGDSHRLGRAATGSQQLQGVLAGSKSKGWEQSQDFGVTSVVDALPDVSCVVSIDSVDLADVSVCMKKPESRYSHVQDTANVLASGAGVHNEPGDERPPHPHPHASNPRVSFNGDEDQAMASCSFASRLSHQSLPDTPIECTRSSNPDHAVGSGPSRQRSFLGIAKPLYAPSRYQIHPDSYLHTTWDLLSVIALMFDSAMVPFIIAWSPEVEGFILGAMWATTLFWSTDVLINFSTGYFTMNGDLEYRPRKIIRRYLKSTMIIDMLICTADWVGIILEAHKGSLAEQGDGFAFVRIIKINRILRVVRVLRVSTIWEKFEKFNNLFLSSTAQVLAQVTALFLFIMWLGHVLCCIWFAIGTSGSNSDTGIGWLDGHVNGLDSTAIQDSNMLYQYSTAYHWSMSQLTPGSMEVFPMNSAERLYTITILAFGLLVWTSLISRLSALMVQLQMANQDQTRIIRKLRTFLRQNNISASTAQRIEKQLRTILSSKRLLSIEDIPILQKLSKPLLRDMKFDMFSHHMLCQPFFATLGSISFKVTRVVCELLDIHCLTPGEELFVKDVETRTSYLLVSGTLIYAEEDPMEVRQSLMDLTVTGDSSVHSMNVTEVKAGYSWLSPAAFWMNWTTKGYMEAKENSEVVCINGRAILETISNTSGRAATFLRHYQRAFINLWQRFTTANDISEAVDHALVVLSLPRAVRIDISEPLLEVIRQKNWLRWGSSQAIKELQDEVSMGKCALIVSAENTPVRVAIVIALRIRRPGGEVLMEVAQIEKGKCKPLARYPGTKVREQEVLRDAARRALNRLAKDLAWNVDAGESLTFGRASSGFGSLELQQLESVEVEWKPSPSYGLQTQYRRNIFPVLSESATEPPPRLNVQSDGQSSASSGRRASRFLRNSLRLPERQISGTGSLELPEISVKEMLDTECPYLAYHHPTHVHWSKDITQSRTTVYAWIQEDHIAILTQLAKDKEVKWRRGST